MNIVEARTNGIMKANIEDDPKTWQSEIYTLSPEALFQIDKAFHQKLYLGVFMGSVITFCLLFGWKISTMIHFGLVIAR